MSHEEEGEGLGECQGQQEQSSGVAGGHMKGIRRVDFSRVEVEEGGGMRVLKLRVLGLCRGFRAALSGSVV